MLNINFLPMYKLIILACFLAAGLIFMPSCNKEEETTVTIVTSEITDITSISASGGGSVEVVGPDVSVTERGICWSINHDPTNAGSKTVDGSGVGEFTSSMTELISNTTYYVRAYAVNNGATSYGNEVSFLTSAETELIKNGDFELPDDGKKYNRIDSIPEWLTDETNGDANGRDMVESNGVAWLWDDTGSIYQAVGTIPSGATRYSVTFDATCMYSYWSGDYITPVYVILSSYTGTDPSTRVPFDSLTFEVSAIGADWMTWVTKTGELTIEANSDLAGKNLAIEFDIYNSSDFGYGESWTYLYYDNISVEMSSDE